MEGGLGYGGFCVWVFGFVCVGGFMRQTEATTDYKEGKAGLRYSPRCWFFLDLWYRKRRRENDYDTPLGCGRIGAVGKRLSGLHSGSQCRNGRLSDSRDSAFVQPALNLSFLSSHGN